MILVKPYLDCSMHCKGCYEIGKRSRDYDIDLVLNAIDREYSKNQSTQISLHGGEALEMPHEHVESILKKSYDLTKASGIQTNGQFIDEEYIEIFKKYKTHVCFSIDGYYPLNEIRTTREITELVYDNLNKCIDAGLGVSTIATANIANCGTDERLDLFKHYILEMTDRGITGRINPYYSPNVPDTTLSKGRAVKVYNELAIMLLHKGINRWSPFTDIVNSLKGNQNVVCVFTLCDVYHTHSATVILGDGSITSCMRGHRFARHPVEMNTRDEILQLTPQTNGGCKDCEFFSKCHGGCPSNTTDWRYKDYFCPVWRSLFEFYSKIFKVIGMDIKEKETSDIDIQQSGDNHSDGITHIDDLLKHLDSDWIPEKQIQREKPFGENHSDGIEHIDNLNRHLDG